MGKTIAERLRERAGDKFDCIADRVADAVTGEIASCFGDCRECHREWFRRLADAIEAEQNASKPNELPEGVIWPRFEDGELVRFGDEYIDDHEKKSKVSYVSFKIAKGEKVYRLNKQKDRNQWHLIGEAVKRPEPEVLDADSVPIHVGDTVWEKDSGKCVVERIVHVNGEPRLDLDVCGSLWSLGGVEPNSVTHRKPDTQEAIDDDATMPPRNYYAERIGHDVGLKDDEEIYTAVMRDLLRRQRKLLGGE